MSIDIKNHADKLYSLRVNDYSSPGFVSCDILRNRARDNEPA